MLSVALAVPLTACGGDETTPVGEADATRSAAPTPSPTTSGAEEKADPRDSGDENSEDEDSGTRGADLAAADGGEVTGVEPFDSGPVDVAGADGTDLTVQLADIARTEAEASMPGEIAGSAIEVDVTVSNAGATKHDVSASVVNLYYGPDRTPASALSGSGQENLPASVPAGEKATGTYVFAVPEDANKRILVEIDVDPKLQVVLFEGEVSR